MEAWQAELGNDAAFPPEHVDSKINEALGSSNVWVLIGGPPCQAYSIVGRVRMRSQRPDKFEEDHRHFLYREYLRILEKHGPPVFVMENVKGLLSAKIRGDLIVRLILRDLERLRYDLYSFVGDNQSLPLQLRPTLDLNDFIICAEHYGVPQSRHRFIILGIRRDSGLRPHTLRPEHTRTTVADAISDLPRLRSRLSGDRDSGPAWLAAITKPIEDGSITDLRLRRFMKHLAARLEPELTGGAEFVPGSSNPHLAPNWIHDSRLRGVSNHRTRAHMPDDLGRYFFVASYAKLYGRSPKLADFPLSLLPNHRNVSSTKKGNFIFNDRFRTQTWNSPATTITSHIAKDGHYFIHPDPLQCRSLTVREAARLQSFPDNYLFMGTRTQQYQQIGNAVPPLLAVRLAGIVHDVLESALPRRVDTWDGPNLGEASQLEYVANPIEGHRA